MQKIVILQDSEAAGGVSTCVELIAEHYHQQSEIIYIYDNLEQAEFKTNIKYIDLKIHITETERIKQLLVGDDVAILVTQLAIFKLFFIKFQNDIKHHKLFLQIHGDIKALTEYFLVEELFNYPFDKYLPVSNENGKYLEQFVSKDKIMTIENAFEQTKRSPMNKELI